MMLIFEIIMLAVLVLNHMNDFLSLPALHEVMTVKTKQGLTMSKITV
uniref:Uncharacterized protein n=1 Tax=Anguilla anguilla TaxID=7936 RepID=A0A0E9QWR7_ANGAN